MSDALGSYGSHIIHEDFYHIANSATLGQGTVSGVGTEAMVQVTDETDGVAAFVTASSAGDTCVFGLNAVFAPASNGPLALECRVKQPTAADAAWMGFADQSGGTDEVVDGGSIDGSITDCAGLYFDDAVDADQWNEYIGTGGAETQQNLVTETITADEWQVLRVEIDPDGTVRMYIADELHASGVGEGGLRLIASRSAAVLTTALLFPEVYSASNSGTGTLEVDYFHFTANRDWAVD